MLLLAAATLAAALLSSACSNTYAAEVTIYRCTDAKGRLSLRDTPCLKGERQETREMLRPSDPPPRPAAPVVKATRTPAPIETTRVVVITPPRPLYECVTPDGDAYTSDTAEGNPRWVPLWTLGYPLLIGGTSLSHRIGAPRPRPREFRPGLTMPPSSPPHHYHTGVVYPAGTWIRDECHSLPPQEVCARLQDRRYALDRRYHSALQSERRQITTEQRGIDARLSTECGAR
ncbi:MAG: DUF4124 domain-containing protein [Pseudomonadota bacterium]|nr:DUF4124 domain-containing protein [Pseudomonadota bacterium]